MTCVARDEHTSIAHLVVYHPPADTIFFRDDFVFEIGPDAQDLADCPVAIDLVVVFVLVKEVVNIPTLPAVDGDHGSAPARVEDVIHPTRIGPHGHQLRSASEPGLHPLPFCSSHETRSHPHS